MYQNEENSISNVLYLWYWKVAQNHVDLRIDFWSIKNQRACNNFATSINESKIRIHKTCRFISLEIIRMSMNLWTTKQFNTKKLCSWRNKVPGQGQTFHANSKVVNPVLTLTKAMIHLVINTEQINQRHNNHCADFFRSSVKLDCWRAYEFQSQFLTRKSNANKIKLISCNNSACTLRNDERQDI